MERCEALKVQYTIAFAPSDQFKGNHECSFMDEIIACISFSMNLKIHTHKSQLRRRLFPYKYIQTMWMLQRTKVLQQHKIILEKRSPPKLFCCELFFVKIDLFCNIGRVIFFFLTGSHFYVIKISLMKVCLTPVMDMIFSLGPEGTQCPGKSRKWLSVCPTSN